MKNKYKTLRFCHQRKTYVTKGYRGGPGDLICEMGAEGTNAAHVHFGIGEGKHSQLSRKMLSNGQIKPVKDLLYYIASTNRMFKYKTTITTYFLEKQYEINRGIPHPALDVVPENRKRTEANWKVYWPLNCEFEVYDIGRYGDGTTYIIIHFIINDEEWKNMELKHDWQWEMLYKNIKELRKAKILNNKKWELKAKNKDLTTSETAWLNMIILNRLSKTK